MSPTNQTDPTDQTDEIDEIIRIDQTDRTGQINNRDQLGLALAERRLNMLSRSLVFRILVVSEKGSP